MFDWSQMEKYIYITNFILESFPELREKKKMEILVKMKSISVTRIVTDSKSYLQ